MITSLSVCVYSCGDASLFKFFNIDIFKSRNKNKHKSNQVPFELRNGTGKHILRQDNNQISPH